MGEVIIPFQECDTGFCQLAFRCILRIDDSLDIVIWQLATNRPFQVIWECLEAVLVTLSSR